MVQNDMCKEIVYNKVAGFGIWAMGKLFPEYFAKDPLRPTDRYIEYPFVLKHLPNQPSRILDVGCAGSMFPLLMKSIGHDVHGIDIRPYNMARFIQEDICYNKFKSGWFDVVTAVSTIEHIGLNTRYGATAKSTDLLALTEIRRILKPYGTLLMTVPFGEEYKVTKYHKVYNASHLDTLLTGFQYWTRIEQSPEAEYKIALIKATKI